LDPFEWCVASPRRKPMLQSAVADVRTRLVLQAARRMMHRCDNDRDVPVPFFPWVVIAEDDSDSVTWI
jgi:hypothetical protein